MASQIRITVPGDLGAAVENAAREEGKTVDELAVEALQRELARRGLNRLKNKAEIRRRGMTDESVDNAVEQAIAKIRAR